MVVTVEGNDQYNGTTKWVVFTIEEVFAVYYTNPNNWSKVYVYTWDASGNPTLGAWPGTEIQKDPKSDNYVVTGLEPGSNVIFSNGSGAQTGDLVVPTNGDCTTDGFAWAGYGETPAAQAITVYFSKPSGWGSNIKVYTWDASGNPTNGAWPGNAMKYDSASGYYYVENIMPGTNIIFNDGSNQTENLSVPTNGDNLYKGSSWSLYSV